ncbi:hypothetical protein LPJ70_003825, partial [Coemansia sp. RSA 2708]
PGRGLARRAPAQVRAGRAGRRHDVDVHAEHGDGPGAPPAAARVRAREPAHPPRGAGAATRNPPRAAQVPEKTAQNAPPRGRLPEGYAEEAVHAGCRQRLQAL